MPKNFHWRVQVHIYQDRGHGVDMYPEPIFSYLYGVESDHALSIIEAFEDLVRQERET